MVRMEEKIETNAMENQIEQMENYTETKCLGMQGYLGLDLQETRVWGRGSESLNRASGI